MKVGIYTNIRKDVDKSKTKFVYDKMTESGIDCYCYESLDIKGAKQFSLEDMSIDCVVVLGGDGTVLTAVSYILKKDILIMGINIGNLGFLTSFEFDEIDEAIRILKNKEYQIEERDLLKVSWNNYEGYALNDVVINRVIPGRLSHVLRMEVIANDTVIDKLVSDGVIVSTPTGSTAYSLSAGGPIVDPMLSATVITPICSHSFHNRPIVLSGETKIKIKIVDEYSMGQLSLDGKPIVDLKNGDIVEISKALKRAKFVVKKGNSFYNRIQTKLKNWSN